VRGRLALVCALLASWLASAAAADVATIQPAGDNTLFEDTSGSLSNGAGPVLFAGNNGQGLARRALVRFDVAAGVPAGAQIEGVELTLHVSNAPNAILRTFSLHRVLEDWGEGTSSTTSGSGAPATANDATWTNTFWPDQLWESIGGSFAPAASASQTVGDVGLYTWTDAVMVADVQTWLDQPAANFGWLVMSDEVTLNTARRFDSRENDVVANRPTLRITYSGTTGVTDLPAAGIRLEPPRPNPAAGPLRLAFVLPAPGHARLEVRDAAGRLVATPLAGDCASGRHETVWDARDLHGRPLAAGVYYHRLVVDGWSSAAAPVVILR
jgi:flagellar hook capping protein FlgD